MAHQNGAMPAVDWQPLPGGPRLDEHDPVLYGYHKDHQAASELVQRRNRLAMRRMQDNIGELQQTIEIQGDQR